MTQTLPQLVMALATHSLGADRRVWVEAMEAEFAVAEADGHPMRFACGCLIGAWRTLPRHVEGRFRLAGYALALGLLLPAAALLSIAALSGFPFVDAAAGIGGLVSGAGRYPSLLNAGTRAIGPALTLGMLLLAACHLPLAWWMLDRDWQRVATAMRFGAATVTALALVTGCAALDLSGLLFPFSALLVEFGAISAIAAAQTGRAEGPLATRR